MGAPVVVQGTAVASPYDHTSASAPRDPEGTHADSAPRDSEGGGEKQVCLSFDLAWLCMLAYDEQCICFY